MRQQKIKLGHCRVLSTLFNPRATSLKPENLPFPDEIDIFKSANSVPRSVVSIQFVDDGDVSEMFEDHKEVQIAEYEKYSDDDETKNEKHLELVKRAYITRFGRAVRALIFAFRLVTVSSKWQLSL